MESRIATYQIEMLDQPFHYEANECSKTVIVRTYVENKLISKTKYGYVTKEEVYEWLKNGQDINLDRCYVKNFSISEYKQSIDYEELTHIELQNFSAQNAFFDCTLRTDFSYIDFKGTVKFNDAVFAHGNVSFYQCEFSDTPLEFKNVEFGNGEISFQYVKFGNDDVLFGSSKFYGGVVSFVNANFGDGNAIFNNVNFYDSKVKFHFSRFGRGDVSFQKVKFGNQTVDFRTVEFGSGRVDFRRSVFGNGYVTFDESEIKSGRFNFRYVRFGNNDMSFQQFNFGTADVFFENVDFGSGRLSFSECLAKKISFKGSRLDVYLDLRVSKVDVIDLSETVLRDIIDMKPLDHSVHIKTLYLNGMRNLGRIIIDWKVNNIRELILSQPDTSLRQKSEQFNNLKENFDQSGQYDDEDEAYILFKRYELAADVKEALAEGGKKYLKLPAYAFKWLIFDKMGLFATSPLRVLFSMIVVYITFSLLYLLLPVVKLGNIVNSVGATDGLSYFQTCFYHSAITFLTIGYGDYYPEGFSRGISVVEGWTGLFLMSYFTVAFVRKILR
ncbi:MAG: two pore domain potassium channel family protein [Flavobacteriales bacterium]|nr:two pore domain potassium channel family protein [Flavobacteriales bacterium]